MGVRQQNRECPNPSLPQAEHRDQVARVVRAVRATLPVSCLDGARQAGHALAGMPTPSGTARPIEQWVSPDLVRAELVVREREALGGDADSARRVAELLEALHEFDQAEQWWRKAADLGDEDAIDHVRYLLR